LLPGYPATLFVGIEALKLDGVCSFPFVIASGELMKKKRGAMLAGSFGAVFALGVLASSALAQTPYTVVMSGLDNPRGMAVAPNGALYVAEAGRGGGGPCVVLPRETRCFGKTGALTRLWKGKQERIVDGLPSHALPDGTEASGPTDISFQGTGGAYVTIGLGGGPAFRTALGSELSGSLIHMAASGQWKLQADVAMYEFLFNPAGGPVDSNPFGVLAESAGRVVADAGANALVSIGANGTMETLAVFPPQANPTPVGPPMIEAVPTSLARGPDGALYVGQLTGFPFVQGLASVYRVVPGQPPQVHCGGFKTIVDIAFDLDGSLLVVEHATGGLFFPQNSGRLTRVTQGCARTPLLTALDRPTSVAVGADGAIYVTNHGVTPGIGEVLRLSAP
jgi:hypothetical protein